MIRLTVLISCIIFLSSCLTLKPVEYKRTENFSVASNNNSPMLSFGIVFYNPNAFGCTITGIESEGSLNNRLVFNAGISTPLRVQRKREVAVPVTARLAQMDLNQLLSSGINLLFNDEKLPVKVTGKIKIRKFIFSRTYGFDYTQGIDKAVLKKLF